MQYFIILILATTILVSCNSNQESNSSKNETIVIDTSLQKNAHFNFTDLRKNQIQKFSINVNKDTIIKGKQGTEIFIPANSFKCEFDTIDFELIECYSISSFIRNNLTTTSDNGQLLSSNGMLYMDSKKGTLVKPIKIKMPTTDNTPSNLFYGKRDSTNNIVWTIDNQLKKPTKSYLLPKTKRINRPQKNNTITAPIERKEYLLPSFSNAFCIKCKDDLISNITYPTTLASKKYSGKIYYDLTIDYDGSVEKITLVNGIDEKTNVMVLSALKKIEKFVPGFVQGKPTKTTIRYKFDFNGNNLDVKFPTDINWSKSKSETLEAWSSISNQFEAKRVKEDSIRTKKLENLNNFKNNIEESTNEIIVVEDYSDVKGYIYTVARLGWINCDYFRSGKQSSLTVNAKEDVDVLLIFNINGNSTLKGKYDYTNQLYRFDNIPYNTKPMLLALGGNKETPLISTNRIHINQSQKSVNLQFDTITYSKLNELIEAL